MKRVHAQQAEANSVRKSQHGHPKRKSHRRSPWACDECRLRKRKCDGSQPCQPCVASDLECAYQFRRPAPPPTQRIRMLEQHLRQAYLLLQSHAQHHPRSDQLSLKPVLDILNFGVAPSGPSNTVDWQDDLGRGSNINSMLAGCRRLISSPPWNTSLYGPLSETAFILRTLEIFNLDRAGVRQALLPILGIFDLPLPTTTEPKGHFNLPRLSLPWTPNNLPNRDDATRLLDSVFKRTHPCLDFLHEASFCSMVTILYSQSPEENDTRTQFLPLFHQAIALGYLWDRDWHRQHGCQVAMDSAMFHFKIGQKLLDTTQLDSLMSLQALLCSAIFLISTSRISRAYTILGLASSTAIRLGLHCDVTAKPNIAWQERSMRIAAFMSLGRLDLYASLMLDLPALLPDTVLDTGINTVYATLGHCSTRELDKNIEASIQHLELLRFTSTTRRAVFTDVTTGEAVESIDSNLLAALDERLRQWTQKISHLLAQVTQKERNSEYVTMLSFDTLASIEQLTALRCYMMSSPGVSPTDCRAIGAGRCQ
ncbi:hypothetical protein, variant [Exophiala mesophila]|uniref:Zn(2)-C6 fungal-type domain-containing protein n=1 Tax=Exophiala mesophila TaxID=212818 RepID=A0A0D1ZBR0_EXOME|nr:hypothetical protein, variant [Exophiala mesophila]KIV92132.1 hypothetical protein, variant [Exophiala mesophila]